MMKHKRDFGCLTESGDGDDTSLRVLNIPHAVERINRVRRSERFLINIEQIRVRNCSVYLSSVIIVRGQSSNGRL